MAPSRPPPSIPRDCLWEQARGSYSYFLTWGDKPAGNLFKSAVYTSPVVWMLKLTAVHPLAIPRHARLDVTIQGAKEAQAQKHSPLRKDRIRSGQWPLERMRVVVAL